MVVVILQRRKLRLGSPTHVVVVSPFWVPGLLQQSRCSVGILEVTLTGKLTSTNPFPELDGGPEPGEQAKATPLRAGSTCRESHAHGTVSAT